MDSEYAAVELSEDLSPLLLSMGQYRLFMQAGSKGAAAMQVYLHLMFTARLQQTNQVKANAKYIEAGTALGRDKVKAAKSWLHSKGMIEYVQRPGSDGKYGEQYIKLRYMPSSEANKQLETDGLESSPPDTQEDANRWTRNPSDGESATNALSKQSEMLEVSKLASAPASRDPNAEEIDRLLKCHVTDADKRFLENCKKWGLTEGRKPVLEKISAKHPRKEVASEADAPSNEELAARLVANDGREYDPDDLKSWDDEYAERADLKQTAKYHLTVDYTERAMELTGTKNTLELANWAKRAGMEIDWENMQATVDAINRRSEEREAIEWPTAERAKELVEIY